MITYTTIQGDTWDIISYRLFNSEMHTDELFKVNTQYADIAIFGAGVILTVPEITIEATQLVAPWLRNSTEDTENEVELLPNITIEFNNLLSYKLIDRHTLSMKNLITLGA